jgi:hypothetical protein
MKLEKSKPQTPPSMFDLEKQIAEWRRQLTAAGLKRRDVLDELESHLREDFEQQIRAGTDAQAAFDAAVRRIGQAESLKTEFTKGASGTLLWKVKEWVAQQLGRADTIPAVDDFTTDGQQTLAFAREEAPRLQHDFIGTEHILLGVTKSQTGNIPKLMQCLGLDSGKISAEIEKWVGLGQPASRIHAQIPFTPRAMKALSLARMEAEKLNHSQVGPEHILLGLLLEGHGVAALVLKTLGVDADQTRAEIHRQLAK